MIMKTSKSIKNIHNIEINTNKKTKYRIDLPYIKYSNKRKKLFPTCKKITYLNVNNIDKKNLITFISCQNLMILTSIFYTF